MMQTQAKTIANIRSFNRFYTNILGLLNQHILDSDFSLTETRVLLEISKNESNQANALADRLNIDHSFMSRILKRLESKGLITRTRAMQDSRVSMIAITPAGYQVMTELGVRSEAQIANLIQGLTQEELADIENAMNLIRDKFSQNAYPVTIRGYQEGDAEYIIRRHREMYAQEYGLSSVFGDYVDILVTRFTEKLDPTYECILIPEIDGRPMGSIAIAKADEQTAQLRFFLLEKEARGFGLGLRLCKAALDFARNAGYRHIYLETINELTTARSIYKRMGFTLTHSSPQSNWGHTVMDERWDMDL